jgi:hypothetical protein
LVVRRALTHAGPFRAGIAAAILIGLIALPRTAPWVAPRAAAGPVDITGVWENNSAAPRERPRGL